MAFRVANLLFWSISFRLTYISSFAGAGGCCCGCLGISGSGVLMIEGSGFVVVGGVELNVVWFFTACALFFMVP